MRESFCLLDDTKFKREINHFGWLFCEIISVKFNGMGENNMQGCVIMSRLSWPLAIIEGKAENEKMAMKWKQNEEKPVDVK